MANFEEFKRDFLDPNRRWTWIGTGSVGGKAQGLLSINEVLTAQINKKEFPEIELTIPSFSVIRTDVFDAFLERNNLREIACGDHPDDVIAQAFQKASLPAEYLGDLRAIIERVHTPLAIRSSSLLEDALFQPFAGVYITKMIPNNQPSPDDRFQKLMEAIKLVYASVFLKSAKDYIKATGRQPQEEKMAVLIQEVVGKRFQNRFYPEISGVARSYNFYAMARARPEDGVVSLALGLGKTVVDGGTSWTYSPQHPDISAPFSSPSEALKQTQTNFWAVNMGKPPEYDPVKETEYLVRPELCDAEQDGTLSYLASTYDIQQDKISAGLSAIGPRVITFAGILKLRDIPLNDVIKRLLIVCQESVGKPVEIEFAVTLNPTRIGFLQVRPMVVSDEEVDVSDDDLANDRVLIASEDVLGNGSIDTICDIIYVKPQQFDARYTRQIAGDIELINRKLQEMNRPYLLIGFGRWGSADPWLGIPVNWGQVTAAKVIVEATLPAMNVDISQGSHFFHNLTSFKVSYFSVSHSGKFKIKWDWLEKQRPEHETEFVKHVVLPSSLRVTVDGRRGRGVITLPENF